MRRLIAIGLLLLTLGWAGVSQAAQAVTFGSDASTTPFITDGIADITLSIASGNFTCVGFGIQSTALSVTSVTDTGGNTYTLADTDEVASTVEAWMYCGTATSSATAITITMNTNNGNEGHAFAWTVTESANTVGNTSSGNANSTSHSSGAVAITGANSIMVGFTVFGASSSPTIDADYTENLNRASLTAGYRAVTAGDTMVNTTGGNRQSATILTEIKASAAAASVRGMLLGVYP